MKKKILLLLSALTLLATCLFASTTYAATDFVDVTKGSNEERVIDIINDLGIMVGYDEEGEKKFKPDQNVTRAEFVTVIRNCIKYWNSGDDSGSIDTSGFNWVQFVYGNIDTELELMYPEGSELGGETEKKTNYLWSDVDETYWAYSYMKDIALIGAIHGYPDGTFRPDNDVSYNEAVKIILSLCGYDEYAQSTGGFPTGYTQLAARFGMNKSVSASDTMPLTRLDVAVMIYNSFSIKLISPLIDADEGRNFLNDIVGVYLLEGTLEATDIASIYSSNANAKNVATVDGTDFTFDNNSNIRDYIGQDIRVFLKKNDNDYTMLSFEPTDSEDVTVIDISLYSEYSRNTFYYYKDEEKSKETKVSVRAGSPLIYNGKYASSYDESTFEGLNNGTITIIEKDDYEFDLIIVEDFESGYTESVNASKLEITDKLKSGTLDGSMIQLESDEKEIMYQLFDSEGNALSIEQITKGGLNYYVNDDYVKVYYTTTTVKGKIAGMSNEDGKYYITIDDVVYPVSKKYVEYAGTSFSNGMTVTISLDKFGEIVWMSDEVSMEGYVYFIKARRNYEEDFLYINYYDLSGQQIKTNVETAEEVKLTNKYNQTTKYSSESLYDELTAFKEGVVKLSFNDEGKITKIQLPLDKSVNAADKLKTVVEMNNDANSAFYKGNYYYQAYGFGGKHYLNANSVVLNVPVDRDEHANYKTTTFSNLAAGEYEGQIYSFNVKSPYAKVAVIYQNSGNADYREEPVYLVTSVIESINSDGEFTKEVTALNIENGTASTFVSVEENGVSAFDAAFDIRTNSEYKNRKIERGDIIQIIKDPITGGVLHARQLYDANAKNPAWSCNDPDVRPLSCNHDEHTVSTLGTIPGSHCFTFLNWGTGNYNANPFSYTTGDTVYQAKTVPGRTDAWQGFLYGYVYADVEGLLSITTQNLRDGFTEEDSNFYWQYWTPSSAKVMVVSDTEAGLTMKAGSLKDIHTYEQVGRSCDKIFMYTYHGTMRIILVLPD